VIETLGDIPRNEVCRKVAEKMGHLSHDNAHAKTPPK